MVGQLDVTFVDNNWISSFTVGDFDFLSEILVEGNTVSLHQEEGERIVSTKGNSVIISGKQRGRKGSKKRIRKEKVKKSDVTKKLNFETKVFSEIAAIERKNNKQPVKKERIDFGKMKYEYDYNNTPHSSVNFTSEDVPRSEAGNRIIEASLLGDVRYVDARYVANTSVNGAGLCRASCGASIINYKKGTNLDALTIYNRLATVYNDTPVGYHYWISKMWSQYGVTMTHKYHKLSYATINEQLLNQNPIYCAFYNANDNYAHAVVLVGTFAQAETVFYVYMDPNAPSTHLIINSIVPSTLNTTHTYTFYYYAHGLFYNNWFESYY